MERGGKERCGAEGDARPGMCIHCVTGSSVVRGVCAALVLRRRDWSGGGWRLVCRPLAGSLRMRAAT